MTDLHQEDVFIACLLANGPLYYPAGYARNDCPVDYYRSYIRRRARLRLWYHSVYPDTAQSYPHAVIFADAYRQWCTKHRPKKTGE